MSLEQTLIATGAEAALLKLHAGIEKLHLLGLAGTIERIAELAARTDLAGVTAISLSGMAPDWRNLAPPAEALAELARAPALTGVRSLTLDENVLDDRGAIALASASWLGTVEELVIIDNPALGPEGVSALAPRFPALRRLYVEACNVGVAGARAIAASSMPLLDLGLAGCNVREEGAGEIFGSGLIAGITRIGISNDSLGEAIARLAIRPASALQQLELSNCGLSCRGAVDFAKGLPHRALAHVNLSSNSLDDTVAMAFAASTGFPALEKLDLRSNRIAEDGAVALGASGAMPALERLGLTDNELFTGKTRVYEWEAGMWEAGGTTVHEKMTGNQIEERFVTRRGLRVF